MRPLQAHCHRGLGTLYSQDRSSGHKPVPPCPRLSPCTASMEMTFWLPQAEATLAEVVG